jgi:hypothetical protein
MNGRMCVVTLNERYECNIKAKMNNNYNAILTRFPLLDPLVAERFYESVTAHIRYVREAGRHLGVPESQLAIHDDSKFMAEEFPAYAINFHSGSSPVDGSAASANFVRAWLHHIHHNPHHWQHWIFPDGFSPRGSGVENGVVEMPRHYALEMIADWMGASMAYTGSWDMADWLHKNMPKIRVHSNTATYLRSQLDVLGYADIVYMQRFAHENEGLTNE